MGWLPTLSATRLMAKVVGASFGAIQKRVERLKTSQIRAADGTTPAPEPEWKKADSVTGVQVPRSEATGEVAKTWASVKPDP